MGHNIVMAFDEVGQADSYERRIEIVERSHSILTSDKVNFPPQDIIFDLNVFPVATGIEEHKLNAIDFFRQQDVVRENLPGAHVSGGVSNVSFSFRGNKLRFGKPCTQPFFFMLLMKEWIWVS